MSWGSKRDSHFQVGRQQSPEEGLQRKHKPSQDYEEQQEGLAVKEAQERSDKVLILDSRLSFWAQEQDAAGPATLTRSLVAMEWICRLSSSSCWETRGLCILLPLGRAVLTSVSVFSVSAFRSCKEELRAMSIKVALWAPPRNIQRPVSSPETVWTPRMATWRDSQATVLCPHLSR